jgi:antitoxin component YwqK of YwqJK toxin-antitoxin module
MNKLNDKGERHGYWERYRANGNLDWKGNYVNDRRNGYWEFYWKNGKLQWVGNYNNAEQVGCWNWYDSNDNLTEKVFRL